MSNRKEVFGLPAEKDCAGKESSTDNVLVSIVMPVYNGMATIREAITSVLQQTYPYFELIVVDDASTDASADIVIGFPDERIHLIRHVSNLGGGIARNTAIGAAKGEWIAVLDADDGWEPNRLSHLLSQEVKVTDGVMLADNLMYCYTVKNRLKAWRKQWTSRQLPFIDGVVELNLEQYLSLDNLLIKPLIPRHVVLEYGITHGTSSFGEDSEFFIRLMSQAGLRLKICEESLYLYRMMPGSMSSRFDRAELMKQIWCQLLKELKFSSEERGLVTKRIEKLDADIRYMPFLSGLKSRQWRVMVGAFWKDPWVIGEFVRRLSSSLPYRVLLFLSGGQGR